MEKYKDLYTNVKSANTPFTDSRMDSQTEATLAKKTPTDMKLNLHSKQTPTPHVPGIKEAERKLEESVGEISEEPIEEPPKVPEEAVEKSVEDNSEKSAEDMHEEQKQSRRETTQGYEDMSIKAGEGKFDQKNYCVDLILNHLDCLSTNYHILPSLSSRYKRRRRSRGR